ncbi:MAG: response regulator transcription factor [Alphaproteobacteria bacterium]|nr:response regulator transcription factor [Alphaproteobacteria bacterium]
MAQASKQPTTDEGDAGNGAPSLPPDGHILLCDDDAELRRLLAALLRDNGYRVTPVSDGREVSSHIRTAEIDLVILDIMLPGKSGLDICREIRATSTVPILMLTAKGSETDRVVGLELGADDYVAKPFGPNELLARIKALIRRARMPGEQPSRAESRNLVFDNWRLDTLRRELRNPDGVIIDVSAGEYDLLLAFLEAPNRVLDRDYLIEVTRKKSEGGFDRSIDVQVSRLRRKLDTSERDDGLIKTVRGAGYMFVGEVRRG